MPAKSLIIWVIASILFWVQGCQNNQQKKQQFNEFLKDSVIIIKATKQDLDFKSPWNRKKPYSKTSLGTVVEGALVMVPAYAVTRHSAIRGYKVGSLKSFDLKLEAIDYELNLALLKPEDPEIAKSLKPIHIGKDLAIEDEVDLIKNRGKNEFVFDHIRLNEIFLASGLGFYRSTRYKFKSSFKNTTLGSPLLSGHQFSAMVISSDKNELKAIPARTLKLFLNKQKSQGDNQTHLVSLGISYQYPDYESIRQFLNLSDEHHGIRVTKIFERSPFYGKLKRNDVIYKVGNYLVDDYGEIDHAKWGKVKLNHIIAAVDFPQDIQIEIFRQGKPMTVSAKPNAYNSQNYKVPSEDYASNEVDYLILAGLVFQEFTYPYLTTFGKQWKQRAYTNLLHLYYSDDQFFFGADKERYVILNKVLPTEFTTGYKGARNLIVDSINGTKVKNLADMRTRVQELLKNQEFLSINFKYDETQVVLSKSSVLDSKEYLKSLYNIKEDRGFLTF